MAQDKIHTCVDVLNDAKSKGAKLDYRYFACGPCRSEIEEDQTVSPQPCLHAGKWNALLPSDGVAVQFDTAHPYTVSLSPLALRQIAELTPEQQEEVKGMLAELADNPFLGRPLE